MVDTLLIVATCINSLAIIAMCLAWRRMKNLFDLTSQVFADVFYEKDANGNIKAQLIIDGVAQIFASKIVSTMSASLKGHQSGVNRTMEGALEEEGLASMPEVLNVAEYFVPGAMKKIGKNPLAKQGLEVLLTKAMGSLLGSNPAGKPSSNGQAKFKL